MTHASVTIQITPTSLPSIPTFLGEVTAFAEVLTHTGVLKTIQEQVRFARARFDTYDLIDFVAVLIGYAVSGEPTLKAFYERIAPFAESFMALFGRNQLPHRSTLSRFRGSPRSSQRGSTPDALSKGSAGAQTLCLSWWLVRPYGEAMDCRGCRWNTTSRPPTGVAADGRLARSPPSV
jgi:hypothetical protein